MRQFKKKFTLIEILFALTLFAISISSLLGVLGSAVRDNMSNTRRNKIPLVLSYIRASELGKFHTISSLAGSMPEYGLYYSMSSLMSSTSSPFVRVVVGDNQAEVNSGVQSLPTSIYFEILMYKK